MNTEQQIKDKIDELKNKCVGEWLTQTEKDVIYSGEHYPLWVLE